MRKMKDSGIEWIGMIPEGSPAFLDLIWVRFNTRSRKNSIFP
jgi:hypothetical protein